MSNADDSNHKPPPEDVAEALRFLHLCDATLKDRVSEVSATVTALLETLVAEGHLPLDQYEQRKRLTVLREDKRATEEPGAELCDVADKRSQVAPVIDCEARLPICKARCCKLEVVLSVEDLDERILRWEYRRPYHLGKRSDGYCVHHAEGGCGVYADRPAQCRLYDCRNDRRIWLDFDARIPAPPGDV